MENYFTSMYQTYLRLREDARFASKHPHMGSTEFNNTQKQIWKDIPSGNGPVEIKMG